MKTRIIFISISVLLILVILSIGAFLVFNNSEKTTQEDIDIARTEAVATFASSLTGIPVTAPTATATPTVEPTFTPESTTPTLETPVKADPCYNLLWLKDVTIPDGTNLKAGETFTKTWLVQNNGGCAWPPGFTFSHVGGDRMDGQTVTLDAPIQVGAKRELSVQLVVPNGINGLIQSSWRLADANGNYFGNTLSVNIVVGNITTPAVTSTP